MGLEKTITNNQGIDVTYWHINSLTIKNKDKHVIINLAGYIDKTKRNSGFRPIINYKYEIFSDTYDIVFSPIILDSEGNPLSVAYNWIKANTEFSDAVDA